MARFLKQQFLTTGLFSRMRKRCCDGYGDWINSWRRNVSSAPWSLHLLHVCLSRHGALIFCTFASWFWPDLSIVKLFLRLEVNDTASVDIVFIRSLWFSSSHRPNSRPSTPWGFLPSGDSVDSVTRGNNFYFAAYFSGPFYLKCREKSSDSISRDSGLVLRLLLLGDNYRRVPIAEPPPKRITVFGKLGKSIWYQGGMWSPFSFHNYLDPIVPIFSFRVSSLTWIFSSAKRLLF